MKRVLEEMKSVMAETEYVDDDELDEINWYCKGNYYGVTRDDEGLYTAYRLSDGAVVRLGERDSYIVQWELDLYVDKIGLENEEEFDLAFDSFLYQYDAIFNR